MLRPIYQATSAYGHFGRTDDLDTFTWERTDKVDALLDGVLAGAPPLDAALGDLTGQGLVAIAVAADGGSDLLLFVQGSTPGAFAGPLSLPVGGVPTATARRSPACCPPCPACWACRQTT